MVVDPEDGSYYVSNINGTPTNKAGNGYISKISSSGNIVIQRFIGGRKDRTVLNAPKGLVIIGKNLFVTDIDQVKEFDKQSGKLIATVDFEKFNAKFLGDLAADSHGVIYVSDMMTNRIFKLDTRDNNRVWVYKEDSALSGPRGLLINPKTRNLIVVTWDPGKVLEIDHASKKIHVLKKALVGLDGVDIDNHGNLYVSSFEKGEIYRIPNYGRGPIATFMGGLTTPAGISYDRKRNEILIPSLKGNTAAAVVVHQ